MKIDSYVLNTGCAVYNVKIALAVNFDLFIYCLNLLTVGLIWTILIRIVDKNHFVGKISKEAAKELDALLVQVLNTKLACTGVKQACHRKHVMGRGRIYLVAGGIVARQPRRQQWLSQHPQGGPE